MALQTKGEGRVPLPAQCGLPLPQALDKRHLLPLIIALSVDSGLQERLDPCLWLRNRLGTV